MFDLAIDFVEPLGYTEMSGNVEVLYSLWVRWIRVVNTPELVGGVSPAGRGVWADHGKVDVA